MTSSEEGVTTFTSGPKERKARLKRVQGEIHPGFTDEEREYAQEAARSLGYRGLIERQQLLDANGTEASPRGKVLAAFRECAIAPLTAVSVRKYMARQVMRAKIASWLQWVAKWALASIFVGPRSTYRFYRDCLADLKQRAARGEDVRDDLDLLGLSTVARAFVEASFSMVLFWLVVWAAMGYVPSAIRLPWILLNVAASSLLPQVGSGILKRYTNLPKQGLERMFELKEARWSSCPLSEYRANVPYRVIDNAIMVQEALHKRGVQFKFEVHSFGLNAVQFEWNRDPFLAVKTSSEESFFIDFWDEEYDPKYMEEFS